MLVSDDVPENLFPVPSKQSTRFLCALLTPPPSPPPEFDGSVDIFGCAAGGGGGDGSGWWPNEVERRQWAVSGGGKVQNLPQTYVLRKEGGEEGEVEEV